jgi:hypothetical protein
MDIGVQASQLRLLKEVSNRQEVPNDITVPGSA